ncbi:MAG: ATP-binding cassette domain-containing protein [Gammaproteobacteria bacterium]|nr:ATP-binding cassette domain-containing protein [Gammaproteobacteria bacterium]
MIELRHVFKKYHTRAGDIPALVDINLQVKRGEIFGVIGKSGAGKSTLIRSVNLLERPDQGEVLIEGKNILTLSAKALCQVRHNIGMIFQHFNLLSSCHVYDNIALPLVLLNYSRKEIQKKVEPLLELTGLTQKKLAYPRQLSGGQKQRVAIARALASHPAILLCDEATSALDLHTTQSILGLLKDINQQFNLTILMITHEMEVVKAVCDRVALLSQGRILELSTMAEFFTRPKTEKAKKLIETLSHRALPEKLLKNKKEQFFEGSVPIWRIYFTGNSAQSPIITALIQRCALEINIFQANVETLKEDTLGIMDVTVKGDPKQLQLGVDYLISQGARVEVLGYV